MDLAILVSLVALGITVLLVIFLIKTISINKTQAETLENHNQLLSANTKKLNTFANELHEIRTGSFGIANRLKELEVQVQELQNAQQNIVEQDPQSRFYNKGVKLISQGASIDEVVRECEMPLAEAELLFNLHNHQK